MLGVFDSGFGGLTVLRTVRNILPTADILYLGDSARTPYGNRSRSIVTQYTQECCAALFNRGCTLIILACNTASADTLRTLQQEWLPPLRKERGDAMFNIIGVVRPLAEEAVESTKNKCIGVVGTRGTVESRTYIEELVSVLPDAKVVQQACPLLVPLVEEGWERTPEARRILRKYLLPLKAHHPDVLILGCTHYEALHPLFQAKMGKRCTVLHTPDVVARKLAMYVERHPEYNLGNTGKTVFLTTGDPERFQELGSRFYGSQIDSVERIEL